MKRNSYVDSSGNEIDQNFESKKIILKFFFLIGTIIPLIIICFIIYTAYQNSKCSKIYEHIKTSTLKYLEDENKIPTIEGENTTISIGKLYNDDYLTTYDTDNMKCTGTIKTTKYKKDYIYTLNLTSCNTCSVTKYKNWSAELNYLPANKPIVDVVPYYNYYERQTVVTDWSKYYEQKELEKKVSKYGIKLPKEKENIESELPALPEEAKIAEVQNEESYMYRYKDKEWKWYDIKGDYSGYSSEKPNGYANKDEESRVYTKWTKYSLTHPSEQEYREILKTIGYQYYYEKNGKKIYANNKNYVAAEDIDQNKYPLHEEDGVEMYSYRDAKWRWYNGQKRHYSNPSSTKPADYNFKDEETMIETKYGDWKQTSSLNDANKEYRTEQRKLVTRFRYIYEILSDPVLKKPVTKNLFVDKVGKTIPEFITDENYKIEVSYKFKYRKR